MFVVTNLTIMTTKKITFDQANALNFEIAGAYDSKTGTGFLKGLKAEPGLSVGATLKLSRLSKALTTHIEEVKGLLTEDITDERRAEVLGEQDFSFELLPLEDLEKVVPAPLNGVVPDYSALIEFICFPS